MQNLIELNNPAVQALLDSLPQALAICDNDCTIVLANRGLRELIGSARLQGADLSSLLPELFDDLNELQGHGLSEYAERPGNCAKEVFLSKQGRLFSAKCEMSPVDDWTDRHVLISIRDNTEHLALIRRLIQSDRLALLDRICSNQLTTLSEMIGDVLSHAGLALVTKSADAYKRCAQVARHQLLRVRQILGSLKVLSAEVEPSAEPLPVNNAVTSALGDLDKEISRSRIAVRTLVEPEACSLLPDELLTTVLLHLLRNALEASQEGEQVHLEARSVSRQEALGIVASHRPTPTAAAMLERLESLESSAPPLTIISVRDAGMGIEEQDLERIFEPMFSTKRSAAAGGLGLTVAARIMERAGGAILVDSLPGSGSTFSAILPQQPGLRLRDDAPLIELERLRRVLAGARVAQTKLLLVAAANQRSAALYDCLRSAGYRVLAADDLDKAAISALRGGFDLALIEKGLINDEHLAQGSEAQRTIFSRPCLLLQNERSNGDDATLDLDPSTIKGEIPYPWQIDKLFEQLRETLQA
ncbi:MAG: ATP-binding protein [Candidatus Alcyoniella australis]|nr:ATP-binding protein [Candidatus Alcyoniella australis]